MEMIDCTTKKWGSSLGVIIPKEIVDKEHIRRDQKVRIQIDATLLAKDLWNLGPIKKTESTQKIKDELRKGW
ncbi:AbrB/MazE/SpoVT family DNA-binding domain-containing protein [archaeon]|nr:AbrB/MazE/SpoVT family DNA-binding domain-containing protein [archaeon]